MRVARNRVLGHAWVFYLFENSVSFSNMFASSTHGILGSRLYRLLVGAGFTGISLLHELPPVPCQF